MSDGAELLDRGNKSARVCVFEYVVPYLSIIFCDQLQTQQFDNPQELAADTVPLVIHTIPLSCFPSLPGGL